MMQKENPPLRSRIASRKIMPEFYSFLYTGKHDDNVLLRCASNYKASLSLYSWIFNNDVLFCLIRGCYSQMQMSLNVYLPKPLVINQTINGCTLLMVVMSNK